MDGTRKAHDSHPKKRFFNTILNKFSLAGTAPEQKTIDRMKRIVFIRDLGVPLLSSIMIMVVMITGVILTESNHPAGQQLLFGSVILAFAITCFTLMIWTINSYYCARIHLLILDQRSPETLKLRELIRKSVIKEPDVLHYMDQVRIQQRALTYYEALLISGHLDKQDDLIESTKRREPGDI